jgi:hypothetical protein
MNKTIILIISFFSLVQSGCDWDNLPWVNENDLTINDQSSFLSNDERQRNKQEKNVLKAQENINAISDYQNSLTNSNGVITIESPVKNLGSAAKVFENILIDKSPFPTIAKQVLKSSFNAGFDNLKNETYLNSNSEIQNNFDVNNAADKTRNYAYKNQLEYSKQDPLLSTEQARQLSRASKQISQVGYASEISGIGSSIYNDTKEYSNNTNSINNLNKGRIELEKCQQKNIENLNKLNLKLEKQNTWVKPSDISSPKTTYNQPTLPIKNEYEFSTKFKHEDTRLISSTPITNNFISSNDIYKPIKTYTTPSNNNLYSPQSYTKPYTPPPIYDIYNKKRY